LRLTAAAANKSIGFFSATQKMYINEKHLLVGLIIVKSCHTTAFICQVLVVVEMTVCTLGHKEKQTNKEITKPLRRRPGVGFFSPQNGPPNNPAIHFTETFAMVALLADTCPDSGAAVTLRPSPAATPKPSAAVEKPDLDGWEALPVLKSLALPTEAREVSKFNDLQKGLGGRTPH
jgi:hypothetical protein